MSNNLVANQAETNAAIKKWGPMLNHPSLPKISDNYKVGIIANLLENTRVALTQQKSFLTEAPAVNQMGSSSGSDASAGSIDFVDPVLIQLIRRSTPNLIAFDVCSVQNMSGPTGLIFALKSRYKTQDGGEALFDEANSAFSGQSSSSTSDPFSPSVSDTASSFSGVAGTDFNYGTGMTTVGMERLGTYADGSDAFNEMAFSIEKTTVTAKGRALKAGYTLELMQDLKQVHGLDAEQELANILATEIEAEINREVVRTIYYNSKRGCTSGTTTQYVFDLDTDSNGRWSVERFKGLHFRIEQEANIIARETRRGKGNILICSSDVASALGAAGILSYEPQLKADLDVDNAGNTFVGTINKKMKVFIDPYYTPNSSNDQFAVLGYKGTNAYDAGFFYCPYIPLFKVQAVDPKSFQPQIGFKTRYGMVVNPFVSSTGAVSANSNYYYRRFSVRNIT